MCPVYISSIFLQYRYTIVTIENDLTLKTVIVCRSMVIVKTVLHS